jgi:hypothetical protein
MTAYYFDRALFVVGEPGFGQEQSALVSIKRESDHTGEESQLRSSRPGLPRRSAERECFAKTAPTPRDSLGWVRVRAEQMFQLAEVKLPRSADLGSSRELAPLEHSVQCAALDAEEFRRIANTNCSAFLKRVPTSRNDAPHLVASAKNQTL